MSERVCPVCGSQVVLQDTTVEAPAGDPPPQVYTCIREGCAGRLEIVAEEDATEANEPTGGDNIGA